MAIIQILLLSSIDCRANANRDEALFEIGYWDYLNNNCDAAVSSFLALTYSEKFENRARLYLAVCQTYLKYPKFAAANYNKIKRVNLNLNEQLIYDQYLTPRLATYAKEVKDFTILAAPYIGVVDHTPKFVKDTAYFQGIAAKVSKERYSVAAALEHFALSFHTATPGYSQTQYYGQYTYLLTPNLSLAGSFTFVNASLSTLQGILVGGIQFTYYPRQELTAGLEIYRSRYPKTILDKFSLQPKPIDVYQFTATGKYVKAFSEDFSVTGSLALSGANSTYDHNSSLLGSSDAEGARMKLEEKVKIQIANRSVAVSYWHGREVLGVRGQGAVIYSSIGDRLNSGYSIDVGGTETENLGGNIIFGRENYVSSGNEISSSALTALVWYNY